MGRILHVPRVPLTLLRPPSGISQRTRWLFGVLAVVSVLLTVAPVLTASRLLVLIASISGSALIASWTYGYLTRTVTVWSDIADALALFGIAVASPIPTGAVALTFGAVWYRALYGSTGRSVLRCGLYMIALTAGFLCWPQLAGHSGQTPPPEAILTVFPFLIITLIVGRQLGLGTAAREASLERATVLATTGSQLLGMTDARAIRDTGWLALDGICAATPGLCVIAVVDEGVNLRIQKTVGASTTGPIVTMPNVLPARAIDPSDPERIRDTAPLNAVAGSELQWTAIGMTFAGNCYRLVIGAKRPPHPDVVLALRNLSNQVVLALSNSAVHEDLSTAARVDALTGLANRAAFTAELAAGVNHGDPNSAQVLFLDLDDFKFVNDEMGHQTGDMVLAEVARRIQSCTRPHDVCARLGGDEFAILLLGASAHDAQCIAQRMVERIAEPIEIGGAVARVGASIGISSAIACPDGELANLVKHADVAMYAAKARGKGRIQIFSDDLLALESPRADTERRVIGAVSSGEIVVHYQPILSVPDGNCTAVEALVRWQHPDRGLLEPDDFLHIAERTGTIIDIGAFVLQQACSDVVRLTHPNGGPLALHVNISASELEHEGFLEMLSACLQQSGLPPAQLVLELAANIELNSVTSLGRIHALAGLGVSIAIDDVGTGQFPLAAIRSLPIQVIKLEQSFLDSATLDAVDRAAAEAIVYMSTQLGIRTIAEGCERIEQQTFLEQLGVDAVQGYLHMPPVPAPQLQEWLDATPTLSNTPTNNVTPLHTKVTA